MKLRLIRITGLFALLSLLLVASGCTRKEQPSTGGKIEPVRICQGGALAILPLIANEQGFFEQSGVHAELVNKGDGKLALEALLAGECNFATCGEPPLINKSFSRSDFAIIASITANENATKIIARRDLGISAAADLRGKTIGVRNGTLSHFFLDQFLKKNNIRQADVTLRFLEPGAFSEALAKGEIVAYSGTDEQIMAGLKKIGDKALVLSEPGLCFTSISLVGRKDYIASHPESVKRVLQALLQAEQFAAEHTDAARAGIQKEKALSGQELDSIFKDQELRLSLQKPLLLTLEDHARWMIETGQTGQKKIPNILGIIDPSALMALKPAAVSINR